MNPREPQCKPIIEPPQLLNQTMTQASKSIFITTPSLNKYDKIQESFTHRDYPTWLSGHLNVPTENIVWCLANGNTAYKIPINDGAIFDCNSIVRCQTGSNDEISAAIKLAKAKGWTTICLNGSNTYRREAWILSTRLGYAKENIKGYVPTPDDVEIAHYVTSNLTIVQTVPLAPIQERDGKRGESTDTEAKPVMTPRLKMGGRYGK